MASGTVPIDSAWAQEAIRRNREGQDAANIAVAVGKNAASVRKVLRAAREQGVLPRDPIADSNRGIPANGNGHHSEPDVIPGQTTVDDHLADFKAEAGEAVGPMPPKPPEETETVYIAQLRIDGTQNLPVKVGGKAPGSCVVTLSGKAEVDGFLRKGDRLRGTFEALVVSEGAEDKIDKDTGVAVEAIQRHKAMFTDLRVE